MRTLDFFAWYPADYRADTTHLTREEDFAYRAILDEIFLTDQVRCRIADDDEYLRRIAKANPEEWAIIRRTLIDGPRAPLTKRGRWISSSRLAAEIAKAHAKSKRNKEIAIEGWEKRRQSERNADASANASDSQSVRNANRREERRKEKKSVSIETLPVAGATLRARLKEDGVSVTKAHRKCIEELCASPGEMRSLQVYVEHRTKILAARNPLSYFVAIARDDASPRLAAVPSVPPVGATVTAPLEAEPAPEPNDWSAIVAELGPQEYLRDAKLIDITGDTYNIGVPSQQHVDEIRERYGTEIRARLDAQPGVRRSLYFVVVKWTTRRSA